MASGVVTVSFVHSAAAPVSPNKQLQRTVMDKVPSHTRQRAAAELRRYAARMSHRTVGLSVQKGLWR